MATSPLALPPSNSRPFSVRGNGNLIDNRSVQKALKAISIRLNASQMTQFFLQLQEY
jgi:hypothetical protein